MLGPAECPEIVIAALRVRPLSADLVYRSDTFPPAAADRCSGLAESDRRTLLQIFRGRERIRWRIDSLPCVCFLGERCVKVCTVFVKRAYSTIPRGFCVIFTAQQLKVGRRTNRVRFCFRLPGSLFLTQKRSRTPGNRSLPCLAGHFRLQK